MEPAIRHVCVSNANGDTLELDFPQSDSVKSLKAKIVSAWHVPMICQQLLVNSELLDDGSSLNDARYHEGRLHVSLIVCQKSLQEKLWSQNIPAYTEAFETLGEWALHDHRRAVMMLLCCGEYREPFEMRPGFISRGDDILVETMTVDDAIEKCKSLPNALGFTFKGGVTSEPVTMHFKSKSHVQGIGWTTYLMKKPKRIAQNQCNRGFVPNEVANDITDMLADASTRDETMIRNELNRKLTKMDAELQLIIMPLLVKIWPPSTPEVVDCMSARLLARENWNDTKQPATRMMRWLGKLAPKGNKHAINAFCCCLERQCDNEPFNVAAAKALRRHLLPQCGHERAIAALCGCCNLPSVHQSIPRTLAWIAPRGHVGAIAALEIAVSTAPEGAKGPFVDSLGRLASLPVKMPQVKMPQARSLSKGT